MKKHQSEPSSIAQKAVKTREANIRHKRSQQAGRKAWKETIGPSEYGYVDELANKYGVQRDKVFHHTGFPDLMVLTGEHKMRFYEIKPKKGSLKRKMLNPEQAETIRALLRLGSVEEVSLVRYEKHGNDFSYDVPIRLTTSNIAKHTCG